MSVVHSPNTSYASTVPDPDLEIRAGLGGGGRKGAVSKKNVFGSSGLGPRFGLKIRGEAAPQALPLDPPVFKS